LSELCDGAVSADGKVTGACPLTVTVPSV